MGWGYGIVNGREVGYSVEATCDRDGCGTKIGAATAKKRGHPQWPPLGGEPRV